MSKISIVFPTRNRPNNLRRFWDSIINTAIDKPEVVVYIDNDDLSSAVVAKELGFNYMQGSRHTLSQCYNDVASLATSDILMFGADDIVFREKSWDEKVVAEFDKVKDKILFVYGHDGHRPDKLGTHGFLHRKWIDTVGYLLPPYFSTWYVDNWITDVSLALNRQVYFPFILAEHMHHCCGKAEHDITYIEAEAKQNADTKKWNETTALRQADIEKLRKVMN